MSRQEFVRCSVPYIKTVHNENGSNLTGPSPRDSFTIVLVLGLKIVSRSSLSDPKGRDLIHGPLVF